ncbi:hypothetical protein BJAS_P3393 [Bathymodiolus japonicus methanotrophic gill symbiont]|uniref:hypothetical protein n=1 Tax=Bathymodiolus japonicus methanotrophic gill symbiont TaxID=113269 RepID=UPI001B3E6B61|nr:hypothetical protein [Bathymodiolus japonicus methanotrophic gill symbiont]GFO72859.1 hypothetical protein BJAS_P3393 [Bathymodiolus japonicus methanotrophic gill symbiont]
MKNKPDHLDIITRICEATNDDITYKIMPEIIKTPFDFIQREEIVNEIQIRIKENGLHIQKADIRHMIRYDGDAKETINRCPGLTESRALLKKGDRFYNKYCISSYHFFYDLFRDNPHIRINTVGKNKIMRAMGFRKWGVISIDARNRTIFTIDNYDRSDVRILMES